MKYNVKEEPSRVYYGLSEVIDLNTDENTPFAEIWSKSSEKFDMKYYNPKWPSIGLEMYPHNFMEIRKFTYSALYPINDTEGLNQNRIIRLPAGKFIRFETTFEELVKGYVRKVYEYIKENHIKVSYQYDYEEYPPTFDHNNPKSTVYVCFRYLGE